MKPLTILILAALLTIAASATSCKKTDYYRQEFYKGDKVRLHDIDPRKSFVPYNCCTCPCTVDTAYMKVDAWFYNIHDQAGTPLDHVDNGQLRKY